MYFMSSLCTTDIVLARQTIVFILQFQSNFHPLDLQIQLFSPADLRPRRELTTSFIPLPNSAPFRVPHRIPICHH